MLIKYIKKTKGMKCQKDAHGISQIVYVTLKVIIRPPTSRYHMRAYSLGDAAGLLADLFSTLSRCSRCLMALPGPSGSHNIVRVGNSESRRDDLLQQTIAIKKQIDVLFFVRHPVVVPTHPPAMLSPHNSVDS